MIKSLSHLILGLILGALIYDLAINLRITYNKDTLKLYCSDGYVYRQIQADVDVFVKDQQQCKTEKGIYDGRNSTQNPS